MLMPWAIIAVLLMVLIVIGARSCNGKEDSQSDKEKSQSEMPKKEARQKTIHQKAQTSWKKKFPNAKIDVKGISKNTIKHGETYEVSLKNVDKILNGQWYSNDCNIQGDKITPNKTKVCTICYVIDGDTIVSRTLNVK